jgi:hypothetical protein
MAYLACPQTLTLVDHTAIDKPATNATSNSYVEDALTPSPGTCHCFRISGQAGVILDRGRDRPTLFRPFLERERLPPLDLVGDQGDSAPTINRTAKANPNARHISPRTTRLLQQ